MISVAANKLGKEICDALGLKHVKELSIHIPSDGLFTVEAKIYPTVDGVKQFPAILKKFKLVPVEEEKETTEIGDTVRSYQLKG